MFELIAAFALAADGKSALHPKRAAQVECVAALGLAANDQARKQKRSSRFPKIAGRDQIFAGAVARRIGTETGRSDDELRAVFRAEISRLQTGALNSPDPAAYIDGRVKPCLPWLKAVDAKAGPDGEVAGLDDGIQPLPPVTASDTPAPTPAPEPGYDPKALRCVARIGLSYEDVQAREGNSKLAQSFAAMLPVLEKRAAKAKDPLYVEHLDAERRFLMAQESRRKTQVAMGIPAEGEAEREAEYTACFALAGIK